MANLNFDSSWEGYSHEDVELAIKERVAQIEGGEIKTLSVSVADGLSKSYIRSNETVQFDYVVVSKTKANGVETDINDFIIEMTIAGQAVPTSLIESMFTRGSWTSGSTIHSPNLYDYVKSLNSSFQVILTVRSSDGEQSTTRTITFTPTTATLSVGAVTQLNPTEITYTAGFDTSLGAVSLALVFTNHTTGDVTNATISSITGTNNSATVRIANPVSSYSLAKGSYSVEAYLILADGVTRSEVVNSNIIVTTGAAANESFLVASLIGTARQYDNAQLQTMAYVQGGSNSIDVLVEYQDSFGNYVEYATVTVANGSADTIEYNVPFATGNVVRFTIDGTQTSYEVEFDAEASDISWSAASDPELYLSARGRSNSASNKYDWQNNGYAVNFDGVSLNPESTNEGWLEQSYLRLIGTGFITIGDFYPFYNANGLPSTGMTLKTTFRISNVSDSDKKVIECMGDDIGFYVTGDGIYVKLGSELVSPPNSNPANELVTNMRHFVAGTKMDLTITIQPYYVGSRQTNHEARYYINGELAGFTTISSSSFSQTRANRSLLKFGGNGAAVLDVYDVRYYNKCLSAFEVLQTRTMDLDSSDEMMQIYEKNNFYSSSFDSNGNPVFDLDSAIRYGKYLAGKLPNTGDLLPFAVWGCTNMCNDLTYYYDDTGEHAESVIAQGGSVERFYMIRFKKGLDNENQAVGMIDATRTFMVEGDINQSVSSGTVKYSGNLRIRRQGTSTAKATIGNIRVDTRGTCRIYAWDAANNSFSSTYTTVGKKANIWEIGDTYNCYLLTCKHNPNDSTQARNLPTAKWYEDCCRALAQDTEYDDCLTYPQSMEVQNNINNEGWTREQAINNLKLRNCVDGIPSVAFEVDRLGDEDKLQLDDLSSHSSFAGQFDLITDKTNESVFGFGGVRDYSIEYRFNESQACAFHKASLTGHGELLTATYNAKVQETGHQVITYDDIGGKSNRDGARDFEYRYPSDDRCTCPGITIGMTADDTLQKLYDLVFSCSSSNLGYLAKRGVTQSAENFGAFSGYFTGYDGDYSSLSTTSQADRNTLFKAEFPTLVKLHQFLFNALAIDRCLMVDQDVKNQFFTHFTGDDEGGIEKLCLLGYDFDTSFGVDNDNLFRFIYTILYSDNLYDSVKSGRPSDLWTLVYANYADELKTIARKLYSAGLLTPSAILRYMHTNHADYYNSIIYNANSEYSYTKNAIDYAKSHGAAKEHNEWFVNGRFTFTAGLSYDKDDNSRYDTNEFRAHYNPDTSSVSLTLTSKERSSLIITTGSGSRTERGRTFLDVTRVYDTTAGSPTYGQLVSKTGIQQIMSLTGLSGGSDDFFYITGAKDLAKIEGLANLKLADITWGNMCNLEEIKLGLDNSTFTNTIVSARTLGFDNAIFSSCKLLILAGLTNVVDPNLSGFVVLETLNCKRMSSLTGITMPSGNSLRTIYLPSNIRTLALDNKTNLELLAIEESNDIEGENLTDITVTSSSEYAALKALDLLGNYIS